MGVDELGVDEMGSRRNGNEPNQDSHYISTTHKLSKVNGLSCWILVTSK